MRLFLRSITVFLSPFISTVALAAPIELITNGDFETGTFAGWAVTDQAGGSGSWFIDSSGTMPLSGNTTVGPASGTYSAVTDQTGPGTHVLTQSFTVAPGSASVVLSFDMFIDDYGGGPIIDPVGLDYSGPPNQHARVDILTATASPFDTGAGVLANYYIGVDGGTGNFYISYLFDITALVGGGGTFTLRFAEVDNSGYFHQGVDNVSILAAPVPVPAAVWLFGSAIGLLGRMRNKKA